LTKNQIEDFEGSKSDPPPLALKDETLCSQDLQKEDDDPDFHSFNARGSRSSLSKSTSSFRNSFMKNVRSSLVMKKETTFEIYQDAWQTTFFLMEQIQYSGPDRKNYQPTGGVHGDQLASLVSISEAKATEFLKNIGVNTKQMKFWGEKRFQLSLYRSEMMFVQLFLAVLEKGLAVNVFEHTFLNGTCVNSGVLHLGMRSVKDPSQSLGLCRESALTDASFCQELALNCNNFHEKLVLCRFRMIPSNRMEQTSLRIECSKYGTSIEICGQSPEHSHVLKDALNTSIRVILEGLGIVGTSPHDYQDHFDV